MFFKFRLSMIVVLSSVLGYLMGAETVSGFSIVSLVVGGFLLREQVTASTKFGKRTWIV